MWGWGCWGGGCGWCGGRGEDIWVGDGIWRAFYIGGEGIGVEVLAGVARGDEDIWADEDIWVAVLDQW